MDKTYAYGIIVVLSMIVIILFGTILYMRYHYDHFTPDREGGDVEVNVVNNLDDPVELTVGDNQPTELGAQEKRLFTIPIGTVISSKEKSAGSDGSVHSFIIRNKLVNNIIVTKHGFRNNMNVVDVSLVNDSEYPIMFVEKYLSGKRAEFGISPPNSMMDNVFSSENVIWQVVNPLYPDDPLGEVVVKRDTKKIIYDGNQLKMY